MTIRSPRTTTRESPGLAPNTQYSQNLIDQFLNNYCCLTICIQKNISKTSWQSSNSKVQWRAPVHPENEDSAFLLEQVGSQSYYGWQCVFPVVPVVKSTLANAGDVRHIVLILGSGNPLEEGMETHSSILALRIPRTEEPGRLHTYRITESDTTEVTLHSPTSWQYRRRWWKVL